MTANERFTLRSLYLYAVCFATLLIIIFAGVNLVRSTVELAYPDPMRYVEPVAPAPDGVDQQAPEERRQAVEDSQRREAVLSLVTSGTLLLIAGPTYVYHWRRIQAERPAGRPNAAADSADK